jgi:hypothetical protein
MELYIRDIFCSVVCPKKLFSDCRAAEVLGTFISDEVGPATLKYEWLPIIFPPLWQLQGISEVQAVESFIGSYVSVFICLVACWRFLSVTGDTDDTSYNACESICIFQFFLSLLLFVYSYYHFGFLFKYYFLCMVNI